MTYLAAETRYDTMVYRRCGESGLKLPAISLGLWHNFGGVDTMENSRAMPAKLVGRDGSSLMARPTTWHSRPLDSRSWPDPANGGAVGPG